MTLKQKQGIGLHCLRYLTGMGTSTTDVAVCTNHRRGRRMRTIHPQEVHPPPPVLHHTSSGWLAHSWFLHTRSCHFATTASAMAVSFSLSALVPALAACSPSGRDFTASSSVHANSFRGEILGTRLNVSAARPVTSSASPRRLTTCKVQSDWAHLHLMSIEFLSRRFFTFWLGNSGMHLTNQWPGSTLCDSVFT